MSNSKEKFQAAFKARKQTLIDKIDVNELSMSELMLVDLMLNSNTQSIDIHLSDGKIDRVGLKTY